MPAASRPASTSSSSAPPAAIAGQNFAHLVVQDVAFFLAHLYEPLKPVVFVVYRH